MATKPNIKFFDYLDAKLVALEALHRAGKPLPWIDVFELYAEAVAGVGKPSNLLQTVDTPSRVRILHVLHHCHSLGVDRTPSEPADGVYARLWTQLLDEWHGHLVADASAVDEWAAYVEKQRAFAWEVRYGEPRTALEAGKTLAAAEKKLSEMKGAYDQERKKYERVQEDCPHPG